MTDLDRLFALVPPPAAPVEADADPASAERTLGLRLPREYVETEGGAAAVLTGLIRVAYPSGEDARVRGALLAAIDAMGCRVEGVLQVHGTAHWPEPE